MESTIPWHEPYNKVDQRLQLHKNLPTTKDDLWRKLHDEWNNIEVGIVHTLVKSMPNTVHALLKAKGGYPKY